MYALNTDAARKADTTGGSIKELGKYVGAFTQAVDITAGTGTKGLAFDFVTQAGQKARLSIYTKKSDGTVISGYDTLMAIMTCMGLRNIQPKPGTVTRYDYDTKADVKEQGSVFAELCKPIGVLLETEDYAKQDGSTGTRMVLKNVFQAATELTASEILDRKTTPQQLEKMVAGLRHRPLKAAKSHAPQAQRESTQRQASSGFEDMDDDIPFANPMRGAARCLAM